MTVWVITLDSSLYPLGYKGGTPGYLTKEKAEDTAKAISEHDMKYLKHRGELKLQPVTAERFVLEAVKIFPYEEE